MKKNQTYLEIENLIKKEKESKQVARIDTFWMSLVIVGLLLSLGILLFVLNVTIAAISRHIESVHFILYAGYFAICLSVIFCAGVYAFTTNVAITEEEILIRSKKILRELTFSKNLKIYTMDDPLIIRSQKQLEEYISALQKIVNPI